MTTKQQALNGLNTAGYSGKLKTALSMAETNARGDYWAAVRYYFLSLGGQLLTGSPCGC